ncbi:MAG: chromosome partitioning protein ParB [Pseudolabrys sp.]|nr:chromosome partitioning protein ParB [Pseudolabrys sp.]
MAVVREPLRKPVRVTELRPTQMTVGMREVKEKRKDLRGRGGKDVRRFLGAHMIPVVLGPDKRCYLVDHHHLALALHDEGLRDVLVTVIGDLSMVRRSEFWTVMDHHGWVYPYDVQGRRRDFNRLPKTVSRLKDDPYRSVAGALRRAGGFAKNTTPFSEFLWADFFRGRIKSAVVRRDFDRAMKKAMKLAKSKDARYLPGWCGPTD